MTLNALHNVLKLFPLTDEKILTRDIIMQSENNRFIKMHQVFIIPSIFFDLVQFHRKYAIKIAIHNFIFLCQLNSTFIVYITQDGEKRDKKK